MDNEKENEEESEKNIIVSHYVDFQYDWGLSDSPKISIEAKTGYLYDMNGNLFLNDCQISYKDFYDKNKIIMFGYRELSIYTSKFKHRKIPLLINVSKSETNYFNYFEMSLPKWAPYPDINGNIINKPTTQKILRIMLEVDREYGNFLNRKFKNG